jgi:hypothetical protein
VPEEFRQRWKSIHLQTTIRNLERVSENIRLISLLQDRGVDVIPLKGVVAAETLFDNLGIYPSGDIDILVRPADLDRAHDALLNPGGYQPAHNYTRSDQLENSYHLVYQKAHFWVEVHWNLTMRYYDTPPEYWWEDTRPQSWRGLDTSGLSPENYILYTVFRLFSHAYYPLRFWALIAGLIHRYRDSIKWDTLLDQAARFRMKRMVTFTLGLLDELWELGLPDSVTSRRIVGYRPLKRLILDGIFNGPGRRHARMICYTSLLDSPLDFVRVIGRRILPSGAELRMRYDIPPGSPKILIYYVLNPVFLLFRNYRR